MSQVAEIRHVALKPLPLQNVDGERLLLEPGELVPAELEGRWLDGAVEAGKVAELPVGTLATVADGELVEELRARGYRVTRAAKKD